MADLPPLGLADQALANVLAAIATLTVTNEPRLSLLLSLLPDLLPAANAGHPHMAPLIREGLGVMALAPGRLSRVVEASGYVGGGGVEWAKARLKLAEAVHNFTTWRAGLAWDALRAAQERAA